MSGWGSDNGPDINEDAGPLSAEDVTIRDYWVWAKDASCRKKPENFDRADKTILAKFMCNHLCPVKQDCLIWGLIYNEDGLWGGMTLKERRKFFTKELREALVQKAKDAGLYYVMDTKALVAFVQELRGQAGEQSTA